MPISTTLTQRRAFAISSSSILWIISILSWRWRSGSRSGFPRSNALSWRVWTAVSLTWQRSSGPRSLRGGTWRPCGFPISARSGAPPRRVVPTMLLGRPPDRTQTRKPSATTSSTAQALSLHVAPADRGRARVNRQGCGASPVRGAFSNLQFVPSPGSIRALAGPGTLGLDLCRRF